MPPPPLNQSFPEIFVLESLNVEHLRGLCDSWRTLVRCSDFQWDSPVNIALRAALEQGERELSKREALYSGPLAD